MLWWHHRHSARYDHSPSRRVSQHILLIRAGAVDPASPETLVVWLDCMGEANPTALAEGIGQENVDQQQEANTHATIYFQGSSSTSTL